MEQGALAQEHKLRELEEVMDELNVKRETQHIAAVRTDRYLQALTLPTLLIMATTCVISGLPPNDGTRISIMVFSGVSTFLLATLHFLKLETKKGGYEMGERFYGLMRDRFYYAHYLRLQMRGNWFNDEANYQDVDDITQFLVELDRFIAELAPVRSGGHSDRQLAKSRCKDTSIKPEIATATAPPGQASGAARPHLPECLVVRGVPGTNAEVANGNFHLAGRTHRGLPTWQKEGNPDKWIACLRTRKWYVTATEALDRDQREGTAQGYVVSCQVGCATPLEVTGWEVWMDVRWDTPASVVVEEATA